MNLIENYNKIYEKDPNSFRVHSFVPDAFKCVHGKRILDLGGGTGVSADYLREKGNTVVVIDISDEAVKVCKEKGIEAHQADIAEYPIPDTFDYIVCLQTLHHVEMEKALALIQTMLNKAKEGVVLSFFLKGSDFENDTNFFVNYQDFFMLFGEPEIIHIDTVGSLDGTMTNRRLSVLYKINKILKSETRV